MKIGDIYVHYKNNEEYMILGFPAFQDNNTGEWIHNAVVLYRNKKNDLFIRSKIEFEEKFIKKVIL